MGRIQVSDQVWSPGLDRGQGAGQLVAKTLPPLVLWRGMVWRRAAPPCPLGSLGDLSEEFLRHVIFHKSLEGRVRLAAIMPPGGVQDDTPPRFEESELVDDESRPLVDLVG